ncbi:HNH endonuclease [Amycolatopsis sp. NPDC059027]|uniref:HNH endonuclease n=1 Tax=Amycolatopsis sp. NPDC059027 TaxID=3346709 RepID=UPI003670F691
MSWTKRSDFVPYSAEYFANRARARKRSQGRCEVPGCESPASAVDHIIPRAEGGSDGLGNLQAICTQHHRQKTAQEAARGRMRRSGRRPTLKHPGRI